MSSAPAPARVQEVSDGVFAYIQPDGTWFINNTGFLTGSAGVTSVDACSTERRTRDYLAAIAATTAQPVRTLINTHHHGDHTHGNYLLRGATIVAHDKCRAEMLAAGLPNFGGLFEDVDWGALELAPPFLTYDDHVTLYSDDLRCDVRYVGSPAHTTNDSIVWIPERSVLFSGDLIFNGGTPFMLMGSVAGAIDVLEGLIKPLGATTIVPGHGDVCGPEAIDDVLGYLRFVLDTARRQGRRPVAPRNRQGDRPRPVRRPARPRAHRRQPAPRLRRPRRNHGARRAAQRGRRPHRHGHLQRRQAAELPRLTAQAPGRSGTAQKLTTGC